jgi:hypothetical protein
VSVLDICTFCLSEKNGPQIVLEQLRLDFLEASTPVNMRLEGSVTQKSLPKGAHQNATF